MRVLSKLFFALLTICSTLPAFAFKSASWPAMSYTTSGSGESSPASGLTVSTILVPEEDEKEFLEDLSRTPADKRDPILIAYRDSRSLPKVLAKEGILTYQIPEGTGITLPSESAAFASPFTARRMTAAAFTWEGVQKAGTWVAVTGVGIMTTMLYISADVEAATAGSLVAAFVTTFSVTRPQVLMKFFTAGGELYKRGVERLFPQEPRLAAPAKRFGELNAAFLYHFITNGALKLALNHGDVGATFGSVQLLGDLAAQSCFSILAHTSWELAFREMQARNPGVESQKVTRLMYYGHRLFSATLAPLIFLPPTHLIGMSIVGVHGVVGILANRYPDFFYQVGTKVVDRLENSVVVSEALATFASLETKTKSVFRPMLSPRARPAMTCQELF